jgi:diguanylate cyclase (GGDEF)-like protein
MLGMIRDVSDVVRAEQDLRHSALHDQLTGLANRRLVTDRLQMALASRSHGGQVATLFLDLDDFKEVNDIHGHLVGDVLLTALAARISAAVRPSDTVGRMGGDEFVVLLAATGTEDLEDLALAVAERIRLEVSKPVRHEGFLLQVGVSIGIAYAAPGDDVDSVLSRADHGMYVEKDRHRHP